MKKTIQITAGRGPSECAWVVAKVLKYFLIMAKEEGLEPLVLHKENGTENGTVQSVSIRLEGSNLSSFLKEWLGTVQWIGQSVFRKQHRRKNWFIGIFELPSSSESTFQEQDIRYQAIRSSGPGGQHVNKVSSAVRAIHLPTGIQVLVSESRSQHQNKKLALVRLRQRVEEEELKQEKKQQQHVWENHLQIQRGNPVKVFKGGDFKQEPKKKSQKTMRKKVKQDLKKGLWD